MNEQLEVQTSLPQTALVNPAEILANNIVFAAPGYSPIKVDGAESQLQQVGIDLRLAKAYRVIGPGVLSLDKASNIKPELIPMQVSNGYYQFESGKQYALDFMEDVNIPEDMAALIVHRSTVNRTIGTVTSGVYDPGFRSEGGCGAIFRPLTNVQIQVGYRMAQITFYTASAANQYDGQYQAGKSK